VICEIRVISGSLSTTPKTWIFTKTTSILGKNHQILYEIGWKTPDIEWIKAFLARMNQG